MQDFLKKLGTKAKSTIKDFFTVTPEEEAKGKKPNVIEKTTKKMGDFFTPAPDKVRVRDVVREVPGATAGVGKEIAKGLTRFALSAGESVADIPLAINELVNPGTKYKVPIYEPEKVPGLGFLGPIESYQNQAKREMAKGETGSVMSFLKAGGNIAMDEPIGVAFKPLGLALGAFIKSGGGKMAQEAFENLAKTVDPKEVETILGSFGIGKKAASELVEPLAKANTADEVKAILGYTDNVAPKGGKEAVEAVSRETPAPKKAPVEDVSRVTEEEPSSMKSIGEILQGRGGDVVPPAKPTAKGGKAPKGDPERRFITRTREMAPEVDELLEGKYKPKSNKELTAQAEKLIAEDYAKAENLARTGTDDQAVAVASKMIEDELALAQKATDEATKNKAYAKAAEIANDAAKNLTEAGRAVQAASLLGKMTPEGMARYAARKIQQYNEGLAKGTMSNFLGKNKPLPELNKDQMKEITDAMEAINKMEDGIDKSRALDTLGKKISKWIPSSIYAQVIGVWKAGLLTGMKTTGINVASNAMHGISEVVKDVPGSIVDMIVQKLFTGKRALTMPSVLQAKQMYKGTGEGVKKGWDFLKTGFDERNIASKLDYRRVNYGNTKVGKVLETYVDSVFRLLGAEDQAFYYAARARSLGNQAEAMAINEKLKGKAARDFAQKLVDNPTEDMLKNAIVDAETAVFQHNSAIARAANQIKKGLSEVVIPFAKTPGNVADQMINYTPVGPIKEIFSQIKRGKFDQRAFSQAMGRGITGTTALAIGSALMANKLMSLGWPSSEKEREQWKLEGRTPNSIFIGGRWRNVGVLGPIGMVMIIGGHFRQGLEETGSPTGALAQAGIGGLSALTEQSFLSGVNRFVDALTDPKRSLESLVSSLAGSAIPTLVADISRGTDKYERRTDGPLDRIQSRIPGARQGLEAKIDAFGQPVETPNFFEVMADATRPGNPTADPKDPVLVELRRLMDADYGVTPTQLGPTTGYKSLTPEQNSFLWKLAGQATKAEMERVMRSKQYDRYDDEQKSQVLDAAIQDAKTEARARTVIQALKGLSDSEQKSKLAEMKEDGLLTRGVFDLYLSLKRKQ